MKHINAAVCAILLQLVSGVSYTGSVAPGAAEYFDLVSHSGGAATNLTVTPLSGTPTLYASCGAAMAFPSAAVHMWTLPLQGSSGATLHITGTAMLFVTSPYSITVMITYLLFEAEEQLEVSSSLIASTELCSAQVSLSWQS
jgi:hypothetical protein